MANTWGALTWNQGSWAAQGDATATVTGISASSSIGSVVPTGIIQVGWGGDSWGQNQWGELNSPTEAVTTAGLLQTATGSIASITADAEVDVTGISASSSIGSQVAGISFTFSATGLQLASSIGGNVIEIGVPVTGISATSSIGAATVDESQLTGIGWGRRTWGNLAWGGAYSAIATGQSMSSSIGSVTVQANSDITQSGLSLLTTTLGLESIQIDSDVFVFVGEDGMTTSQGSQSLVQSTVESPSTAGLLTGSIGNTVAGLKLEVPVTGISASLSLGSISLQQGTTETVSGQALASALGTITSIPTQMVGVSGLSLTTTAGAIASATGTATVDVTGIGLTASIGTPIITAWAEIDPGVTNTWSEVDLAA
tara:strand:- start:112 stop:1221 length:1110 start_codon:yes stop_codon:yes gene_type:complete